MNDENQEPFFDFEYHVIKLDELRTFINTKESARQDMVFLHDMNTAQKRLLRRKGGFVVYQIPFAFTAQWMDYSVERMRQEFAVVLNLVERYPHFSFLFFFQYGKGILEVYAYKPEDPKTAELQG